MPEFSYPPVEIFGAGGGSLNISGGTIQVNTIAASGTSTVVIAGSSSTVQVLGVFAGTQDVRALGSSTVQVQAGTLDVRPLGTGTMVIAGSSSSVQLVDRTANTAGAASSLMILGTGAATILAQNTSRNYASITVSNGTLFLGYGTRVPSSNNYHQAFLTPGIFEFNRNNLFTGQLQAVMSAASSTVAVLEW